MYLLFTAPNGARSVFELDHSVDVKQTEDQVRRYNDRRSDITAHICDGDALAYEFEVDNVLDVETLAASWDTMDSVQVRAILTGPDSLSIPSFEPVTADT
jgi:hypothetical protein